MKVIPSPVFVFGMKDSKYEKQKQTDVNRGLSSAEVRGRHTAARTWMWLRRKQDLQGPYWSLNAQIITFILKRHRFMFL